MKYWPLILITTFGLGLRLFRLNTLPGEMWGDVIEHYKMVQSLKEGTFFYHYNFGGDGPLFTYIATIVSVMGGLSFYTLKLTSVLIGTLLIPSVYVLAQQVNSQRRDMALISAWLAAVSFWGLTFSRQAKPYILVPLFTVWILIFLIKKKYLTTGILLGLGMYTQAAFWGMSLFIFRHYKIMTGFLLGSSLFILSIFQGTTALGGSSYIGEKFGNMPLVERVVLILHNVRKTLIALIGTGDSSFRHTIPQQSHLDSISALLCLVGFMTLTWQSRKRRHPRSLIMLLIIAFVIIQLPALADVANPGSNPNMGRTIGILPILIVLIAYGIKTISDLIPLRNSSVPVIVTGIILAVITVDNLNRYFVIYPQHLPNHNISFSNAIVQTLESRYRSLPITMIHCCWGEGGQPEPDAIHFQLFQSVPFNVVTEDDFLNNPRLPMPASGRFILLTSPTKPEIHQVVERVMPVSEERVVTVEGQKVVQLYLIDYN